MLAALDNIAEAHAVSVAAVTLAWLAAQPTILAALASARSVGQVAELQQLANVRLSADELDRLSSAPSP